MTFHFTLTCIKMTSYTDPTRLSVGPTMWVHEKLAANFGETQIHRDLVELILWELQSFLAGNVWNVICLVSPRRWRLCCQRCHIGSIALPHHIELDVPHPFVDIAACSTQTQTVKGNPILGPSLILTTTKVLLHMSSLLASLLFKG